jgi:hypothetical protein
MSALSGAAEIYQPIKLFVLFVHKRYIIRTIRFSPSSKKYVRQKNSRPAARRGWHLSRMYIYEKGNRLERSASLIDFWDEPPTPSRHARTERGGRSRWTLNEREWVPVEPRVNSYPRGTFTLVRNPIQRVDSKIVPQITVMYLCVF